MGLKEILRKSVLIDAVVSLFKIDLRNDEYQEGNSHELREEAMPNLRLAQSFVSFNTNASYFMRIPPKSRLYSSDDIAKILTEDEHVSNLEEGIAKAKELIEKRHMGFYFASKGAAGVDIVSYKNEEGNTKYRFEVAFCDA